ncbi:unnamed protein product [Ectocarpus sp. 12 AP-2014]
MFWAGSGGRWRIPTPDNNEAEDDANREDWHHRGAYTKGVSGGSTTKGEGLGYTSPRQYLQPDGAAPCADGLAWGFDGEGFDNGNFVTHTDKNPAKVGGKPPAMNLPQDDRDTGTDVGLVSVSTAGTIRCDAVSSSPSSPTSLAPSLALVTSKHETSEGTKGEGIGEGKGRKAPPTFSSIDEWLMEDQKGKSSTTSDQDHYTPTSGCFAAGGSGTDNRRLQDVNHNSDAIGDDGDQIKNLPSPLLPGSMSLAPHAEENSSAGGLQGLSPGPGQDTYAAKFRSPYPNSQQPSTVAEQSILSAFDATSPVYGRTWGNGSFVSPGAASVQTASSLCLNDEGEETDSKRIGAWGEEEEKEEEEEEEEEEDVQMTRGKDDGVHEETTEGESDNMEVAEEEDDEKGTPRGEAWEKAHEEARAEEKGPVRRRHEELSFPDGGSRRAVVAAAAASPEKNSVGDSPVSGQARGSATSLFLGLPDSEASGDAWGADDTPRLDDYFRGQATAPPLEGQLLPPPFGGGMDESPLFPSPPLEGRALYGLSTWSFGSGSGGGGNGGSVSHEAAPKPSAGWNSKDGKPTPVESFSYHANGRMKADDVDNRRGDQKQQQQQQRGNKRGSFRTERPGVVSTSTTSSATTATAVRRNSIPRRGSRFLVGANQAHTQSRDQPPERSSEMGEDKERRKRNMSYFTTTNVVDDLGPSGSITHGASGRHRGSCNGGRGAGGHQKRHQEWLDKFGEEKRMERQEEEAKAHRQEAARRRTRDLLLERAKQRLLAVAAAAAGVSGAGSSTIGRHDLSADEGGDGVKISAAAREASHQARGGAGQGAPTPTASCEGGAGVAVAAAAAITMAAMSAGVPFYAQETWAARHSKVERKGNKDNVTPEERKKLEKERFERIAATRRRQKEHHKRFLAALKAKRIQEEEDRLLHERKEAEKRCNVKMWAERRLQKTQKAAGGGDTEHLSAAAVTTAVGHNSVGGRGSSDGGDGAREGVYGEGAGAAATEGVAGSGLNAIRSAHSRSDNQEDEEGDAQASTTVTGASAEELEKTAKAVEGLDKEERRRRFFEVKLAREKAQRHLESLVKKKKEKADEEENAKRRRTRRMRILRDKVLFMAKELRQSGHPSKAGQRPETGAESSEEEKNGNGNTARVAEPPRLTDEELQTSVERLTQQRKGGGVITASARDFNDWKRKHKVAPETKVFVMTGWYPCVKKALIERGWTQNHDRDSPFFDLKWTLHSQDIRTTDIEPWQLCNHFFKNVAITTKAGLLGNLRNLKWFADCDCSEILPRGYDLSIDTDVLAFLDDYCATAAESLLKHVFLRAKGRVALRRLGSSAVGCSKAETKPSPRLGSDGGMDSDENDVYDDDDDAFDDSSVDDEEQGEETIPKPPPRSVSSALMVSPKTATPTVVSTTGATAPPSVSSIDERVTARNAAADPGGAMTTPPESARGAKPLAVAEGAILPTDGGVVGGTQTESRAACEQTADLGPVSAAGSVAASAATPAVAPSKPVAVEAVGTAEVGTPMTAPPPSTQTGSSSLVPGDSEQSLRKQHQQPSGVPVPPPAVRSSKTTTTTTKTGSLSWSMVGKEVGRENGASTDQKGRAAQATDGTIGKGDGGDGGGGAKLRRQMPPVSARRRPWEPEGAGIQVNAEIIGAALAVCRRRHARVGEGEGGLDSGGPAEALCSELEWELIGLGTGGGAPHPDMPGLYRPHPLPSRPATPLEAFIQTQAEKEASSKSGTREGRRRQKQQDDLRAACTERVRTVVPLGDAMLQEVEAVLERAAMASRSQFDLNGDFCQNMWIVKPAAKSRGRGIECFTELDRLLSYTESKQPQAVSQWVVHKYIENPLIIARRKFDMRQWVLVTDWNPLTVWFYDRCYVRFGVEEYTTSGSNIGNNFVHLVNNSICKKSDKFGKVSVTDNGIEVHEHMWSNEVFTAYVDEVAGEGCWRKRMQPRMEQIVTWSLLCAQDLVEHRKKSWELYGYDFMVDDQYKPWLIEINSSPACDYSTKVTEQYVQAALTDLLKVTIDLPAWEANQRSKNRSRGSQRQASSAPSASDSQTQDQHQQQPRGDGVGVATKMVAADSVAAVAEKERHEASTSVGGTTSSASATLAPETDRAVKASITPGGDSCGSSREENTTSAGLGAEGDPVAAEREDGGVQGRKGAAEGREDTPPDTGLWRLLYKGSFVPFPVASFGTDLALKGTRIAHSKRTRSSPHAVKL